MKNKIKGSLIAAALLLVFSGCWQTGDGQYVGIITKVGQIGGFFTTTEAELHLVDAKGTMVADHVELSVDANAEHGEPKADIIKALLDAQEKGTRVKVTVKREAFVGCWRAETDRLITKIELLQ